MDDLATSLRVLRAVKGWQGRQLAIAAKVSPTSLSVYENGKKRPSSRMLCKLVGAMGYTMDALDEAEALIEKLKSRRQESAAVVGSVAPGGETP